MTPIQRNKPFAPGNAQRGHDKEGVVTTLPDGTRFTAYTPLAFAPKFDADELEFMMAAEAYKRKNHRPFPTLRELLAVAKALGYRKQLPTEK